MKEGTKNIVAVILITETWFHAVSILFHSFILPPTTYNTFTKHNNFIIC